MLVIEDEDSSSQVLADALADEGYQVRTARDGREGLATLGDWRPDRVLLDLMMPVMDGWAFRAEQQRLPDDGATVPVIVLSGAREARAPELRAVEAITRPFELDDIVAAVGRWVRRAPRDAV